MHWRPALLMCSLLSCGAFSAVVSPPSAGSVTQVSCDFESDFCSLTNDNSADFAWARATGKMPTYDTGPSSDHTTGQGFYVYLESSAPQVPGDRCRLVTPPLAAGRYSIGFWYSAWGADVGVLALLARDTSNGGRKRLLWLYKPELNGSKEDGGWVEVALSDVDLPKASAQLVWEGIRGSGTFGDIGLDDIAVTRVGDARPLASGKPDGASILPYECTFEEPGGCGMTSSWQSTGGFAWSVVTGPAQSINTGPSADRTFRNVSGHFMLLDVASREQFEVAIESTPALYSTCGCVELSFWWHGFGAQLGSLTVTLEDFDDQPLFSTGSGDSYNRWRQANVTLQPPTDRAFSILFRGEVGSGALGDYAVDDISVEECSHCFVFTTQAPDAEITTDYVHQDETAQPAGDKAQPDTATLVGNPGTQAESFSVATTGNVEFTTEELTFGSLQTDPTETARQSTLDPQLSVTFTAPDASTKLYFTDSTTDSEAISTQSLSSTEKSVLTTNTAVQSATVRLETSAEFTSRVSTPTPITSASPHQTAVTLLSQTPSILTSSTRNSFTASPGVLTTETATSAPSPESTQLPPTSVTQLTPTTTTYASTSTMTQTSTTSISPQALTTTYVSTAAITQEPPTTSSQQVTTATTATIYASTAATTFDPSTTSGQKVITTFASTAAATIDPPATSSQQVITTTYVSTAATTFDPPSTSGQQVLTTSYASPAVTTFDPSTTTKQQVITTYSSTAATTFNPPSTSGQQVLTTSYASPAVTTFDPPATSGQQVLTAAYTSTAATTYDPPTVSSRQVLTTAYASTAPTTQETPAISNQQILSTTYASTAATTYDPPTASGTQVLATTRASAPTTTQEPATSTRGPTGQFYCDFESPGSGCQLLGGSNTGAAAWLQTKVADRPSAPAAAAAGGGYPATDHTFGDVDLGTYMAVYVANESSGSASLVSADVYNPGGCNRLEFWVYAAGVDVGSLTVALSDAPSSSAAAGSTGKVRYLWLTSGQNLSSWTKVVSLFKAIGPFVISFTAKGSSSSWTTFAIDDVRLSAISCNLVVDVPAAGGSTSTGVNGTVYMTGTYGVVQTANFPNAYPDGYSQKWNITVAGDSRIAFTLALLDTEACCDVLQVFDTPAAPGAAAAQLMRASGVLTGEPQTYLSSGSTILVSFAADWDVSLTGFRLQWWAVKQTTSPATTTVATTTHLASFGQFGCSFDVGWCGLSGDTSLDYGWILTNQPASNHPSAGPSSDHTTGLGAYVYANSKSPGNSNVARLLTTIVYSADGCSVLAFYYHASGPALGSLTVRLLGVDSAFPNSTTTAASTVLWYTSGQATSGWTQAVAPFRYSGAFRLAFEAKRINGNSLGDYALDDVAVTTCAGLTGLTTASTTNPYADNGNTTYVNGDYGTLRSPNYPLEYLSSYQHTWQVTVSPSKRVALFVNDLLTEACCDILRLIDGGTGRLLQALQGVPAGPVSYYSDTNNLTVIFETDSTIQMKGWQLTWWAVAALDPLPATAAGSSASASPTTVNATTVSTTTAESTITTSTATGEWQSTATVAATTMTTTTTTMTTTSTGAFEEPTTEINSSGSGASAQTGVTSSTVGDWIYLVIAIAIAGAVCTVALSVCLWHKRQKNNKVGSSTEGLRDSDQLEDAHTVESGGEPTNTRNVPDQEVRGSGEANKPSHNLFSVHQTVYSRLQPPTRWPYIARNNELYDRLDRDYEQIDNAPPSSNSDDWKLRNVVINPLHPRRQRLYLGEDGQPQSSTSGGQKQHKKNRRHKHRNGSGAKPLAPLRGAVAKVASSLGSAVSPRAWSMSSTSRVSPAVFPESTRSIISIPGGGVRPPRPEMVVLGGGRRQPDNPPTTSVA